MTRISSGEKTARSSVESLSRLLIDKQTNYEERSRSGTPHLPLSQQIIPNLFPTFPRCHLYHLYQKNVGIRTSIQYFIRSYK
jgi:hypothetical protein